MDNVIEGESLTPLPRKPGESITISFPDAIQAIISGKKVRRMDWTDEDYGLLKGEWLTIFTKGKFHTWSVSLGDMEANDWYIMKEAN